MTTIGNLIERVTTLYSKGVNSDDVRAGGRHIYHKLKSVRNKLITQQLKKRQVISDWNYTLLPCVELIRVSDVDCPCIPDVGCYVYRTKNKLPKILTNLNKHIIQFVMNVTSGKVISETSREEYIFNAGNKYTSNDLKYILESGYLYVYGKDIPKLIKIKLLAEDPIEAADFPSICGNDCKDCECESMLDKIFPIDGDLVDTLIEMSVLELIEMFSKGKEDKNNNTSDD